MPSDFENSVKEFISSQKNFNASIEEKILTLKKRKEALASALISGEETLLSTLSSDDLRALFDLNSYDYH